MRRRRARRPPADRVATLLICPLVFGAIFLAMWLSVRIQEERKRIVGMQQQCETLAVKIEERHREISLRAGFEEIESVARSRGLEPAEQQRVLALQGAGVSPPSPRSFSGRVVEVLSEVPVARANPVDGEAEPWGGPR